MNFVKGHVIEMPKINSLQEYEDEKKRLLREAKAKAEANKVLDRLI